MTERGIRGFVKLVCVAACLGMAGCEDGDDDGGGTEDQGAGTAQFAGNWSGTYSGDESGTWACTADSSGAIRGSTSGPYGRFSLVGSVSAGGDFAATAGTVATGASFTGRMTAAGAMDGTWRNPGEGLQGSFKGSRR